MKTLDLVWWARRHCLKKIMSLAACILLLTSVFSCSALALDESAAEAGEVPAESGQPVELQESSGVESGIMESSEASGEGDPAPYVAGVAVAAESPLKPEGFFEPGLYSGAATYSYPLKVPPGTAGMTPEISLSYSSQAAKSQASPIGLGWSLTESYILRDVNYTPDDTSDDEFDLILDGRKFDLVFTEEYAGTTVYKTKVDSFMQVLSERTPQPCVNDHCLTWLVRAKDGTTYSFGELFYSELESTNRDFVVRWNLDTISDTHGNRVYFDYIEEDGVSYVSSIHYNFDRRRVIEFVWETRPDACILYSGGTRATHSKRLKEVQAKADGSLVRKYVLDYTLNDAGTKSLLASIRECGSDGSTCLPETRFNYYVPSSGWVEQGSWIIPTTLGVDARVLDVNGDGLADILRSVGKSGELDYSFAWVNTGSGWVPNPAYAPPVFFYGGGNPSASGVLGDVNGDGLPDLIPTLNGSDHYWMNSGTGWISSPGPAVPTNLFGERGVQVADVNGDGFDDIVEAVRQCLSSYGCSNFVDRKIVWINDGVGWVLDSSWVIPEDFFFIRYGSNWSNDPGSLPLDVNGDGLADLVQQGSIFPNGVWLNNGSGWEFNGEMSFPVLLDSKSHSRLADLNGDGLADIIKAWECTLYGSTQVYGDAWLNTGSGWASAGSWVPPTGFFEDCDYDRRGFKSVKLADINGDGFSDIIRKDYDNQDGLAWFNGNYGSPAVDAMMTLENSLGGRIDLTYASSTAFDNAGGDGLPDLGFPVMVVSAVTEDNGLSGERRVTNENGFAYEGGLYDFEDREFRGFGRVTAILSGRQELHFFHQDDARKAREYRRVVGDLQGNLWKTVDSTWAVSETAGVYDVSLTRVDDSTFDGVNTGERAVRTEYEYDPYGNVVKVSRMGEAGVSGDERFEHADYRYDEGRWIMDRPSHTVLAGANAATVYREAWFDYDMNGDLIREEHMLDGGVNPVVFYEYDSFGNMISETDPLGRETSHAYDPSGTYLIRNTNPLGHENDYGFDFGRGNLLWTEDANGYRTIYEYDVLGRVKKEVRPYDSPQYPTIEYHYLVDGVAPEGVEVLMREGPGQSGTYDSYSFTDGFGRVVQSRADADDGVKQVVTDSFYDGLGRMVRQSVPYFNGYSEGFLGGDHGLTSSYSYDPLDRVIAVVNTDGSVRTIDFDRWSVTVVDENGHERAYILDAFERIVGVEEINGGETYSTVYEHSPRDDLTRITDSQGNVFNFEYDTLGRKTGLFDPDLGEWSYEYDAAGNMIRQTDGRGVSTDFQYDELSRLTIVDYSGDADVEYAYDQPLKGVLSRVSGAFGSVDFEYDSRLRPVRETWNSGGRAWVKDYAYDSLDRITSVTYPGGETVDYEYDDQGLVGELPSVASFEYDAFGRPTRKTFANGLVTQLEYYPDDFRLKNVKTAGLQDLTYTFDDVGNVKSITSAAGESYMQAYTYDSLDRLTGAAESGGFDITYAYDSIGNLLQVNANGAAASYAYGTQENAGPHAITETEGFCSGTTPPASGDWNINYVTSCTQAQIELSPSSNINVTEGKTLTISDTSIQVDGNITIQGRIKIENPEAAIKFGETTGGQGSSGIQSTNSITLTYDGCGSLTSAFGLEFEYDDGNKLRNVRRGGAIVEAYVYDPDGNRFRKASADGSTTYYVGKDFQTKVYANGSQENTIYYYVNNELLGRKEAEANKVYFYHNDHLGGANLVTDEGGQEVERTRYAPYGGILSGGASRNLYTGQEWDSQTGQYYYGARYYNPNLRRFTQADTIIPDVYDPQSLNRYSYTVNNPLKFVDPTGHIYYKGVVVHGQNMLRGANQFCVGVAIAGFSILSTPVIHAPGAVAGGVGILGAIDGMVEVGISFAGFMDALMIDNEDSKEKEGNDRIQSVRHIPSIMRLAIGDTADERFEAADKLSDNIDDAVSLDLSEINIPAGPFDAFIDTLDLVDDDTKAQLLEGAHDVVTELHKKISPQEED